MYCIWLNEFYTSLIRAGFKHDIALALVVDKEAYPEWVEWKLPTNLDIAKYMDEDEDKIAAEENLLNEHLACVKEEAQLITQEGELITKIERQMVNEAQYDMRGYLAMAEDIAKKKLEMYSKLLSDINEFRGRFGDDL
jgi:hypothetical protein